MKAKGQTGGAALAGIVRQGPGAQAIAGELKTELIRKSLHFLIALSPATAALNRPLTASLLAAGTLFYAGAETLRLRGVRVPVISAVTLRASRRRDEGRFVLGPVTLGLGSLLALLLYPFPAAAIGIYALAFGDGFAGLAGKFLGTLRPSFLRGKSVEGSLACFTAVYIAAWEVSGDYRAAFAAAATAAVVEALPLGNYDNIALPLTVGFAVRLCGL